MTDLLRLCRLYYVLPISGAYALTVVYALGGTPPATWGGMALSAFALALVVSAAYVVNDVCDRDVDRVNAPQRPVAAGRVQPAVAVCWGIGLAAAGLVAAAMCRWLFLLTLIVVAVTLAVYNLSAKRLGLGKQLLVAALMTSIYPLALAQAGGAVGRRAATLAIFPIWMFLTSFGYECLKDIRDIAGDHSAGDRLTWIQRSPRLGRRVSQAAVLTGAAVLIGPSFIGCGWVYTTIAGVAMAAALATVLVPARWSLVLVYSEYLLVGVAATADIILLGF